MDNAKRYFTKLEVDEIHECKTISKDLKICKQTQPVQITHLDEVCEAQMIEPIRSSPISCSQRIVELTTHCGHRRKRMVICDPHLWCLNSVVF
jgi:hypothetical protein